ncbi:hypothetical protein HH310_28110 [Actinoplanes sp. TBRC 11911]|uniref:hypothetical protein n=1 Tax=Actinoplanes sp. TBRC 11911 TaxID=2729386 RepID=UPI00145E2FA6|nr:hypothetical protein [Actinoplanes sp. TBRC 11911]NMO55037.1 hypothetical protein [Actinoplanes sp. TBRC 11911]
MTTTVLSAEPAEAQVPRRKKTQLFPRILPWIVPAALAVGGLVQTDTPIPDIALYVLYLGLGVVLPGTLVHRALRGSRGNWPEDLGLGAATGLLVMLVGWALAAATGLQALLPGWPLLILVLFAAVPRLRGHWRIAEPEPLPVRWSWIMAGGLVVVVVIIYTWWRSNPLPPVTAVYYQDLMYHLALVHEMTRSMPFQVPQLAGNTLRYTYLADADMAVGSMVTRIDPSVVLFRLWILPVAATAVFVAAVLARDLAGKWWAGALGGVVAILGRPLVLGAPVGPAGGGTPLVLLSPSQVYALPLVGLLVLLAVDLVRGRRLRWAWLLVGPLALACAGAKSSALPPVVAGMLVVTVMLWFKHRERFAGALTFLGVVAAATVLQTKLFAGGGASVLGLQPFALLNGFAPYKATIGYQDKIDGSRFLPFGVANASAAGLVFIAGITVWCMLMQGPRLLSLAAIGTRRTRGEPAAWLLAGMTLSGLGAAWLLWHPSLSQAYFFIGVIPFATVGTVWLLADHERGWRPVVAGLLAGGLWSALAPPVAIPPHKVVSWAWALTWPLLRTALLAAVVIAIGLAVWRFATKRMAWRAIPIALLAAVVGAGLGSGFDQRVQDGYRALTNPPPTPNKPASEVTGAEMTAALWLQKHSGDDDVIATNVHCVAISSPDLCDARAFWVSGLSGRRAVVESWGYTDQAVAQDGVNGQRYNFQPAPEQPVYQLNQRVFQSARAADVAELRRQFNVRWLFADQRATGGVSPDLGKVATARFSDGPVTVYQLP